MPSPPGSELPGPPSTWPIWAIASAFSTRRLPCSASSVRFSDRKRRLIFSNMTRTYSSDQSRANRVDGGLDAVLDSELHQDVRDVVLHRLRADVQLAGDVGVVLADGDEAEHLELARGEVGARPACVAR